MHPRIDTIEASARASSQFSLMANKYIRPLAKRTLVCFLSTFVAAMIPAAVAAAAPQITSITYTGTSSNVTATISGSGFGAAPSGVPCVACSTPYLSFGSQRECQDHLINIPEWNDTQIVVNGLAASPGNNIITLLTNATTGESTAGAAMVRGNVALNQPKIRTVKFSGTGQNLEIVVLGSGFGNAPLGVPGLTDVAYFAFDDFTQGGQAGYGDPDGNGNATLLNYVSWTDSKIIVSGMSGGFIIPTSGDAVAIELWSGGSCSDLPNEASNLTTAWGGSLP